MVRRDPSADGFTLIELVVLIVLLGILAAFAVPRYMNVSTQARIATLTALAGTLHSTAHQVRALCLVTSGCDLTSSSWQGTLAGKNYWLNYGWPDSGDELGTRQIDALIDYAGFRAYLVGPPNTRFVRDDAPTPNNCSVTYNDAYYNPPNYSLTIVTNGC